MIINPQVPLHRLILSLSDALDCVHPLIAKHQLRVAYIATSVGRQLGLTGQDLLDLFHAGALHDIGLVRVEDKKKAMENQELERIGWHAEAGARVLQDNPFFAGAALAVRYHHTAWLMCRDHEHDGKCLPLGCHVLALADATDRFIDRKSPVLVQRQRVQRRIIEQSGKQFHPDCVSAFQAVTEPESFWLDCISERVYNVLLRQVDWPTLTVDAVTLQPIGETFARVVDAKSPWTATHTAGVATSATALAERAGFSQRELQIMKVAGYLHDLGKLTVSGDILDKPGKLDQDEWAVMKGHTYHTFRILETIGGLEQMNEWASFHHERLDGTGYPFRHRGDDLTLGARIMAVADVFTALTEDRPYRAGMDRDKTLEILRKLVDSGGLDGDVFATLVRHYDDIDATRRQKQDEYRQTQEVLTQWLHDRAAVGQA